MNCRESAPRVLNGLERPAALAHGGRKRPPVVCGQIGLGEILGQFMTVAARRRGRDEQSVRNTKFDDGKGFLPGIDPVDTVAEAFRSRPQKNP